ncbi:hypothetical protein TWF225_003837 [Orbilia oligospora]|uniref:F-box domain-containing protein n=1 Tax=Orbilia oligospora TaxID=2813651 RepID=A0A8H2DTS6_ORBOL|nr:hypothetical protein TWF225_003837 [Orbilia oligospora]KAF3248560.1 hypothetical protein TWF128_008284 [Orbilia oligospora]KAF3248562.1 hypothetical protein TWF128_008284 [Orbilia oligospora]KAF3295475.1 hypothetical protein TWF132_001522 [Orbilia oligospora]TGJ64536.1 hypothetical protein EYR41_010584 [Orbilia oligospora]
MDSKMDAVTTPVKNLKRARSPSEEEDDGQARDSTSNNTISNTTTTTNTTKPFGAKQVSSASSPLDLGLPDFLVSPFSSAKRLSLGHNSDDTRRITRHAAAANDPSRKDPFEVLPDNVVRMIIFLLPPKSIVKLRRVSKFWKGNVEYVVTQAVVEKAYGGREATEKLKKEAKLGWPEFAFRKNAFLDNARAAGAPTSVKKFTNAQLWELVGDRLVWIDDSTNLNVQHLSAWDVNERKDSLVALAGNPRAFSKNKFLHSVIADEQRKASAERPKRSSKKEKAPEAIIIRWSLRDTLKNRRTKIKVNFLVPYGSTHIILDYFQCDETGAVHDRWNHRFLPQTTSRNKLACINIITGYADWNINLEDFRLAFPPSHGLYLRPRYQYGSPSYLIHKDKAYSFTSPDRRHPFVPHNTGEHRVFLTVRDCKTGATIEHKEMKEIGDELVNHQYPQPEHTIISPDGRLIVLNLHRNLWICNAQTRTFVEKVELPWLQYSIVGSRFDLEFNEDGSRLYLTEECNGADFNVIELDSNDKFKPVFIKSYHVPTKNNFVSRTSFNHKLQTQVLTTRNPSQPMSGEWRPEIVKFISMDELMEDIPKDLWAAEWRLQLANPNEKWNWAGPGSSPLIPQLPHPGMSNASAILAQISQLNGGNGTSIATQISVAIGFNAGILGNPLNAEDGTGVTPRGKMFLETPRQDYVLSTKAAITLPPLAKLQPNAIQEPAEESSSQAEWRMGGVYYTGPATPKKRGRKTPKKSAAKVDESKMHERREWWIGGRMSPFKLKNGERFIVFDQDDTVYCCDFGPVGW